MLLISALSEAMTVPTDFRSPCKNEHSRYGQCLEAAQSMRPLA